MVVAIVLIGGYFVFFNKPSDVTDGPMKVGVILPLSGNAANYGEQVKKGIDIALSSINKDGNNLEVIYEDNQFDPKLGLSAYNKLVKLQGIKYLISFGGNVCPYINPLAQKDGVVNFATGCNTLDFKDSFSYNFRFDVAEREASKAIVDYVATALKPKSVGLIYVNNEWGAIVAGTVKDALTERSISVAAEEKFNDGSLDARTQIVKLKAANPDAVFFLSLSNFTPILLKQMKEIGLNKPLFTNISIQSQEVIQNAGSLSEGILYSAPNLVQVENTRIEPFNQAFPDPNSRNFASWGFDSVHLFNDAFKAVGDNAEKVAGYLHDVKDYGGAFGLVTYDASGELKLNYAIKAIRGGEFVEIK